MQANPDEVIKRVRKGGAETAAEIASAHGPLWEGRDALARLILSLSSAILVGTITFAQTILSSASAASVAGWLLIVSWCFLFGAILLGLASLHRGNTLKSFRARFVNAEPDIREEASQLRAESQKELMDGVLGIIKKYSDASLEPLGSADVDAERHLRWSLWFFAIGLAVFLVCGGLQIT